MTELKDNKEKKPVAVKKTVTRRVAAVKAGEAPKKVAAKKSGDRSVIRREAKEKRPDGYCFAVGRRKRAVSKTKLWTNGKKLEITVNGRDFKEYFPVFDLQEAILAPLRTVGLDGVSKIEAQVEGGGMRGQAEAVRLGVSRALLVLNADFRSSLKVEGFLTRDPREKERKKYGLKRARRSPQWSKR